jgi:hypothetical protein
MVNAPRSPTPEEAEKQFIAAVLQGVQQLENEQISSRSHEEIFQAALEAETPK